MSQVSLVKAERALANRAHVRMLLRLRQPAFAAGNSREHTVIVCLPAVRRPQAYAERAGWLSGS
jgi:hypothetical protein